MMNVLTHLSMQNSTGGLGETIKSIDRGDRMSFSDISAQSDENES